MPSTYLTFKVNACERYFCVVAAKCGFTAEQLNSNLRLNVPGIHAQVFLCFRVLLIRMSPMQLTSLWPIIISEMLQVFLQVEQELATDTEEFR